MGPLYGIWWRLGVVAAVTVASPAYAEGSARPRVTLTRLDCGELVTNDLNQFSDTYAFIGQSGHLTDSCYLIRHGEQLMVWDTGLPADLLGAPLDPEGSGSGTLKVTLQQQLAELSVQPEDVDFVGISHYHFDHTGQASIFERATLLLGQQDFSGLTADSGNTAIEASHLASWLAGERPVTQVTGDLDVFGDGSVVMLTTPGHTPGHHALLVQLEHTGPVILSGDAVHILENLDGKSVPPFNADRADTLASLSRLTAMARNLGAIFIIQHDRRDVGKLPPFPKAAR